MRFSFIRLYGNGWKGGWDTESKQPLKVVTEFAYGEDKLEALVSNLVRMNVVPEEYVVAVTTNMVKWVTEFLKSDEIKWVSTNLF